MSLAIWWTHGGGEWQAGNGARTRTTGSRTRDSCARARDNCSRSRDNLSRSRLQRRAVDPEHLRRGFVETEEELLAEADLAHVVLERAVGSWLQHKQDRIKLAPEERVAISEQVAVS